MAICKACGQAIRNAKVGISSGNEIKNTKGLRKKVTSSVVNKAGSKPGNKAFNTGVAIGKRSNLATRAVVVKKKK